MNNSLKTHRIRSKQVSLDSIRLTLPVRHKNRYLSFKNEVLYRKNFDFRDSPVKSNKNENFVQNSSNMLNNRVFLLRLSIVVEIYRFSLDTIVFSRNRNRPKHEILAIFVNNSLKTHRICCKQVAFDSIRLTL